MKRLGVRGREEHLHEWARLGHEGIGRACALALAESGATVALAAETALPVVATHPVQFLRRDDFRAHEARVCIAEGYVLADQRRPRVFTRESYFKTQAEMAKMVEITPQQWAKYEAGMDTIGAEALTLVCSRFVLSADVILGLRSRSKEPIPPID